MTGDHDRGPDMDQATMKSGNSNETIEGERARLENEKLLLEAKLDEQIHKYNHAGGDKAAYTTAELNAEHYNRELARVNKALKDLEK